MKGCLVRYTVRAALRVYDGDDLVAVFGDERMASGVCKLLNSTWRKWCFEPPLKKEEE